MRAQERCGIHDGRHVGADQQHVEIGPSDFSHLTEKVIRRQNDVPIAAGSREPLQRVVRLMQGVKDDLEALTIQVVNVGDGEKGLGVGGEGLGKHSEPDPLAPFRQRRHDMERVMASPRQGLCDQVAAHAVQISEVLAVEIGLSEICAADEYLGKPARFLRAIACQDFPMK